jgi:hypothetical protein
MRAGIVFWFGIVILAPLRAQDAPPSAETLIREAVALDRAQAAKGWKWRKYT